jgi:hypothetical protein
MLILLIHDSDGWLRCAFRAEPETRSIARLPARPRTNTLSSAPCLARPLVLAGTEAYRSVPTPYRVRCLLSLPAPTAKSARRSLSGQPANAATARTALANLSLVCRKNSFDAAKPSGWTCSACLQALL